MNLFLEGPIRIGNSTALQNILRPVQAHVGGIIVQRLWQDGIIVGFRSVALDGKFPTLDVNFPVAKHKQDELFEDVFIYNKEFKPDVLKQSLTKALAYAETDSCNIILLDEIGGQELLYPDVMELLLKFFTIEKPRCGVLKSMTQVKNLLPLWIIRRICCSSENLTPTYHRQRSLYIVEPSTLPLVEQALLDKMGSWIQIDSNSTSPSGMSSAYRSNIQQ